MRHQKKRLQIGRSQDHKQSLERNLITQLFLYEKIKTTERKAKLLVPKAERLLRMAITREKMQAIRELNRVLNNPFACKKVMEVYKERYQNTKGGYMRVIKIGPRRGDNAPLVFVALV